jgi:hypothetical protein
MKIKVDEGKAAGTAESADRHGVLRCTVCHWIEEGMPHVEDNMPHTAKARRDGITLLEIIDRCRKKAAIGQLEALGCDQTKGVAKMVMDEAAELSICAQIYKELA